MTLAEIIAAQDGLITRQQALGSGMTADALRHVGPEAKVSGSVACRAHGLDYVPAQAKTLVLVPDKVRRQAPPSSRSVACASHLRLAPWRSRRSNESSPTPLGSRTTVEPAAA